MIPNNMKKMMPQKSMMTTSVPSQLQGTGSPDMNFCPTCGTPMASKPSDPMQAGAEDMQQ